MTTTAPALCVLTTFASADEAEQTCRALVERKLVACAQLLGTIRSFYRWKGSLESSEECGCLLKTTAEAYPALEAALRSLHSYEVPEIVAIPIAHGSADYLQWLRESVAGEPSAP